MRLGQRTARTIRDLMATNRTAVEPIIASLTHVVETAAEGWGES